jgi:hypothetical protein
MKRSMDREGCPKLFSLCVEYRTTVLLRGVSLLKVVGNHIVHKTIHQPSHIAALGGTPRKDLTKSFAEKVVEAGVSGAHRPECPAGDFSASVTKCDSTQYQNRILAGMSPDTFASALDRSVRSAHAGVSGPAGDSGVRQPETPGAVSDNGSISWAL